MAMELIYTSAVQGLRPGSSGFCTVAMTRGLPPSLVPRLEALGGYRPGPGGDGPRARCFWRVEHAGTIAHVLAVVGPAPPDHTQRTNKIASYLLLSPDELAPAGPGWLLAQPGILRECWTGEPHWIETPVRLPGPGPDGVRRCSAWQAAAGDAGWAGVVASAFLRDQSRPIHVIWGAGMDPMELVCELMSLLPPWARWRCTFSTYFLQPVAGTPCALRFCLRGTPAADAAAQSKGLVVDLSRPLGPAPDSRFARMARTGEEESPGSPSSGADDVAPDALHGSLLLPELELELGPDAGAASSPSAPRREPRAGSPSGRRGSHPAAARGPDPMTIRIAVCVIGAILVLAALGTVLFLAGRAAKPAPADLPGTVPSPMIVPGMLMRWMGAP